MREFFNRVIGDFVGLTESANKVEALSQQVSELSNRIYTLEQENHSLHRDLQDQVQYARDMADKVSALEQSLHDSQEHTKVLQETIVAADTRVTEVTHTHEQTVFNLQQTERERDEARNSVKDYEIYTSDLKRQIEELTQERDNWKQDAQKNSETIVALNATLSRVQSILNPPSNVEPFPQYNVG